MATGGGPSKLSEDNENVSSKLDTLINAVKGLKCSQDEMKRMFESKLDKLRSDLMSSVDTKIRVLRDELSVDIARKTNRIYQVLTTIQAMQMRIDGLEIHNTDLNTNVNGTDIGNTHFNDSEVSITASGRIGERKFKGNSK